MAIYSNIEAIYRELAESVPQSGWNMWVDMANGEPFQVWLTPPGEQVRYNRHTLPLDFVVELDEFNPVAQRLLPDEHEVIAKKFVDTWFSSSVADRVIDSIQDPHSYFHHATDKPEALAGKLLDEMRIRQLDASVLGQNNEPDC